MEETYERLPEVVEVSGVKIEGLKARLIMRSENKAIYLRDDKIWEVIRPKKKEARVMFGKAYPPREIYPSSEEFGKFGWAFNRKEDAIRMYEELPE